MSKTNIIPHSGNAMNSKSGGANPYTTGVVEGAGVGEVAWSEVQYTIQGPIIKIYGSYPKWETNAAGTMNFTDLPDFTIISFHLTREQAEGSNHLGTTFSGKTATVDRVNTFGATANTAFTFSIEGLLT